MVQCLVPIASVKVGKLLEDEWPVRAVAQTGHRGATAGQLVDSCAAFGLG